MRTVISLVAIAVGCVALPAAAAVTTLTFDGNICGASGTSACSNGSSVGASHGTTAEVAVSYFQNNSGGPIATNVNFWSTGYGSISNVIYGAGSGANEFGISFAPASGIEVRLISFAAGCFAGRSSCLSLDYDVTSAGFSTISGTATPTGALADVVTVNSPWTSSAIRLGIGPDTFNGALDNVVFESRVAADVVPEPASWALLMTGFGLVGAVARRRQAVMA